MNLKEIHGQLGELITILRTDRSLAHQYGHIGLTPTSCDVLVDKAQKLRGMIPDPIHADSDNHMRLLGECEIFLKGEPIEVAYNRLYEIGSQTGFSVYKWGDGLWVYGERTFEVIYWHTKAGVEVHSVHEKFPIWHNSEISK